MQIEKSSLRGLLCGVMFLCINIITNIFSFYVELTNICFYSIIIISSLIAMLFYINQKAFEVIKTFLTAVGTFFLSDLIIGHFFVNMAFKHVYGASEEMWAGDGFGMLVILFFDLGGLFVGLILTYIISIIRNVVKSS